MKTILAVVTILAFSAAFTPVLADEFPTPMSSHKDIGAVLYDDALTVGTVISGKDFGSYGPVVSETETELGTVLYNEAFLMQGKEISGAAAGGLRTEEKAADERTVIWDHILGPPGGSDY